MHVNFDLNWTEKILSFHFHFHPPQYTLFMYPSSSWWYLCSGRWL